MARLLADARDLSLLQRVPIVSGAHLASYLMGYGGVSSGLKREGRDAGQSQLRLRKRGDVTSLRPYAFMAYRGSPKRHFPLPSALNHQMSKI